LNIAGVEANLYNTSSELNTEKDTAYVLNIFSTIFHHSQLVVRELFLGLSVTILLRSSTASTGTMPTCHLWVSFVLVSGKGLSSAIL
jgi:hypothetical protein